MAALLPVSVHRHWLCAVHSFAKKKRNNQSKQKSQSTDDRRRELEEEISIDDEGTRGTEIANISPWVSDGIIVE